MKRHEKDITKCEERRYIADKLFYLAWNNDHCCQLESVGRKKMIENGIQTLFTVTQITNKISLAMQYQDRVLKLIPTIALTQTLTLNHNPSPNPYPKP